jgi:tetratricopeptide (TPR) repeat protein
MISLRSASGAALCVFILALSLAACSSAPRAPDAVYDTRNKAAELAKLGDGFMAKMQFSDALRYYEDALKAGSSVDDLASVAASHASMGRTYLAAGETEAALGEYEASLDYARLSGEVAARSRAQAGLGEVAFAKGDATAALSGFEEAVALASGPEASAVKTQAGKAANQKALAIALHDRGVAKASLDRRPEALVDLRSAEALNLKAKRWTELGANRYAMASTLAADGRFGEAMAAALGALDADKRAENARALPADLAAAASLSSKLGKDAEAWDYWRRSFDSAMAVGDPASVRKALTALVALAPGLNREAEGSRYATLLAKLDAAEASPKDK